MHILLRPCLLEGEGVGRAVWSSWVADPPVGSRSSSCWSGYQGKDPPHPSEAPPLDSLVLDQFKCFGRNLTAARRERSSTP